MAGLESNSQGSDGGNQEIRPDNKETVLLAEACVGAKCKKERAELTDKTAPKAAPKKPNVKVAPEGASDQAVLKMPNARAEFDFTEDQTVGVEGVGELTIPKDNKRAEYIVGTGNINGGNIANLIRMKGKGFDAFRTENKKELKALKAKDYFKDMRSNTFAYRMGKISDHKMATFLKPVLETSIPNLSTKINEYMYKNGLSRRYYVRMVINSAYRTQDYQQGLTKRNSMATKSELGSAHERGNTADIAYNAVDLVDLGTNKYKTVYGGNILALYNKALTEVLADMASKGVLNARKEIGQPCYHTSFYFDAKTFKAGVDKKSTPKTKEKPKAN